MSDPYGKHCGITAFALIVLLMQGLTWDHAWADRKRMKEAYPGLAAGALKSARLTELDQGILLEAEIQKRLTAMGVK